jgi:hypothetical protein
MWDAASKQGISRSRNVLAFALVAAATALPVAADANVIATFDWVSGTNTPENPATAATTAASGTLTLNLSTFALTGTSNPPSFGPHYTSGANATTASIQGLSYTFADGANVVLTNVTSESVGTPASPWQTSGLDVPSGVQPPNTTAAYYLISGFSLSGTADGANFQISNNIGTAGATFPNGIGNGDNSFNGAAGHAAVTDGGYWQLASITPIPLPSGLLLLFSGLGLAGMARRYAWPRSDR